MFTVGRGATDTSLSVAVVLGIGAFHGPTRRCCPCLSLLRSVRGAREIEWSFHRGCLEGEEG